MMVKKYISPIKEGKEIFSYEELTRPLLSDNTEAIIDALVFCGRYYKEIKKSED